MFGEQQWTLFPWVLTLCQKNVPSVISVPTNVLELRILKEILFYLHLMLIFGRTVVGGQSGSGKNKITVTFIDVPGSRVLFLLMAHLLAPLAM